MMGPRILACVAAILLIALVVNVARSPKDGPQMLLEMAVRSLPDSRRDWGAAMTAELDRLQGRAARWSFALGCARAALIPPRSLTPVLLTAAGAATLAAAMRFAALDPMRPFIVTLCAAAGLAATATLARSKKPTPPGKTTGIAIAAGALASIATTIYLLARYPTGHDPVHSASSDGRNTSLLITGAILITGYLWLTLTPPPALATNPRAATTGTTAGLIYAAGYLPATMFLAESSLLYYLGAPIILFTAAAIRGGTVAALWAGLTGALWTFSIPLLAHFRGYQLDAIRLDDTEPGAIPDPQLWFPSLLGQDLGNGFFGLVWLPLWALLLGLIGARITQAGQAFRQEYART
jgi:hypothetical protein